MGDVGSARAVTASWSEPVDRGEHPVKTGAEEIFPLGEEVVQRGAAEFEPGLSVADAEGHVGFFRGDIELTEEAGEERVGGVVEHHETGVDGDRATGPRFSGGDRIRVTADVVGRLEEGDVEVAVEKVGAAEAGDAGADDGETRLEHGRRAAEGLRAIERLGWEEAKNSVD